MTFDLVRGFKCDLDGADFARGSLLLASMVEEGRSLLHQAGFTRGVVVEASADMRFSGQRSEVNVPLPRVKLSSAVAGAIDRSFRAVYGARYGRDVPEVKPEFVNLRVTVRGPDHARRLARPVQRRQGPSQGPSSRRPMLFDSPRGLVDCPAYDRAAIAVGKKISGPAVVEDRDSTAVLPPRWTATLDQLGNLILTR
jgi:N-methylhydantoinase A/oxoprolinase/acetone carboxylase beta subunit